MQTPKITESEFEIMKILWKAEGAVSSVDIIRTLSIEKGWNKSTTLTLIGRLVEKGAIKAAEKIGKAYCYYSLVDEKDYLQAETVSFMKRMHGGRLKNLIATLADCDEISDADLEELQKILKDRR